MRHKAIQILLALAISTSIVLATLPSNSKNIVLRPTDPEKPTLNVPKLVYVEDQDRAIALPAQITYNIPPHVFDIDDDGVLETVVIGDLQQEEGKFVFLIRNARIVSGWPIGLYWGMDDVEILGRMDINNGTDPRLLIKFTDTEQVEHKTKIVALTKNATIDTSYEFYIPGIFNKETVFYDLNNDTKKEFLLIDTNNTIYYLDHLGNNITNWPIQINETISYIPPIAEDVTGDGELEIIVTSDKGLVVAFYLNGTVVEGYPLRIPLLNLSPTETIWETPMIYDFNNDNNLELFAASTDGILYGISLNTTSNKTWSTDLPWPVYLEQGAVYDIDNDGYAEILQLMDGGLGIYRVKEDVETVFLFLAGTGYVGVPALADLDRDNLAEIILLNTFYAYILEDNGDLKEQIPNYFSVSDDIFPLIYDIDNDKEVEITYLTIVGYLLIKETNDYGVAPWISKLGSPRHTPFKDSDNDGLWDYEEEIIGTDKNNNDTDGDTISDGLEVKQYVSDPHVPDIGLDSDEDGISNIDEVDIYGTNPLNPDTDFDTINDGDEILVYFTSPFSSDTDEDGMPDDEEITYSVLDPNNPDDAFEDPDEDGLLNVYEISTGTNPENPDTDGDGLLDGEEIYRYYTNPLQPDANADYDGDGLTNVEEVDIYLTDPSVPDTDGDGFDDGTEVNAGSNPLKASSIPGENNLRWLWSLTALIPISIFTPIIIRRRIIRKKLK